MRSFLGEFRVAQSKSRNMTYGVTLDFGLNLGSNDADKFTAFIAFNLKYDSAVGRREQGMILAEPYVVTGMEMRAALTHDDVSGFDDFTTKTFNA